MISSPSLCKIMSVLHFNSNKGDEQTNDSLHKIWPVLNVIKYILGAYIDCGSEWSLDEATVACHSSYRCGLLCFNAQNNCWKLHIKTCFASLICLYQNHAPYME